jgi:hypothetical protein
MHTCPACFTHICFITLTVFHAEQKSRSSCSVIFFHLCWYI